MSKLAASLILLAGFAAAPAPAALGPHAAACAGGRHAMLVRITGLKARSGTLRVQSYGGDPAKFLDSGSYIERVEVSPPAAGPIEVCMPVPRPGVYAIAVRHQISGKSSNSDGGGVSGNPKRSVVDLVFKRKPDPEEISVRVNGTTVVPIILNYVQGGSFKPLALAGR